MEIGNGLRNIWVVTSRHSDGSGNPEFLAAYDGENAKASADALVEIILRAGSYQTVEATAVPLWPLLVC